VRKLVHPLAVSRPMPFSEHRNMQEVQETEKLQALHDQGKLTAPWIGRLRKLLERATFPNCRKKEPEDVA
jgi:hypothetical protein